MNQFATDKPRLLERPQNSAERNATTTLADVVGLELPQCCAALSHEEQLSFSFIFSVLLGTYDEVVPRSCQREGSRSTCGEAQSTTKCRPRGHGHDLGSLLAGYYSCQLLACRCELLRRQHWHRTAVPYLGVSRRSTWRDVEIVAATQC